MKTEMFKHAYDEFRNGANGYYRHWAASHFLYSDGVKECADAGIYWVLDILATECVRPVVKSESPLGIVYIVAKDSKAHMRLELEDDVVTWEKQIGLTDLPDGTWTFYLGNDGDGLVRMILPSEY